MQIKANIFIQILFNNKTIYKKVYNAVINRI